MRETNDEPFVLVTNLVGLDGTTLAAIAARQRPVQPPPTGTEPEKAWIEGAEGSVWSSEVT